MAKKELMYETLADIAYFAGQFGYYSGNSRDDMQHFIFLAKKFEEAYKNTDWEDLKPEELDYMEAIEKFAMTELKLKKKLSLTYPHAFDQPWDSLEVERCREDKDSTFPIHDEDDEEPNDFWSVYVHMEEGGAMCMADVPTEKDALDLMTTINRAVRTFKDNGFLSLYDNKNLKKEFNKQIDDLIGKQDPKKFFITELQTFKSQINKILI